MATFEWVNNGRRRLIVRVPDGLRLDTERGRELAWLGVPARVREQVVGGVFENEYHRAGRWAIFRVLHYQATTIRNARSFL